MGEGVWLQKVTLLMGNTGDTTTETVTFVLKQGVRGLRFLLKSKVAYLYWARKSSTRADLLLEMYLFGAFVCLLAFLMFSINKMGRIGHRDFQTRQRAELNSMSGEGLQFLLQERTPHHQQPIS
jgi:hypothetical protein